MISPHSKAQVPVFSIVVSEKGGAERREEYDNAEINVGRVQGNELMLPKGNVSKRHARLLYRDGRFIVTDLNSTNGTYVNRRRISQATIVREGDRIYIGDFVLRIEVAERSRSNEARDGTSSGPVPRDSTVDSTSSKPEPTAAPSEDSAASYPKVPGPPRVPSTRGSMPLSSEPAVKGPRGTEQLKEVSVSERSVPGVAEAPLDPAAVAHSDAMAALADLVEHEIDTGSLDRGEPPDSKLDDRLTDVLEKAYAALQKEGKVAASVDRDALLDDVRAELTDLGALAEPLEDSSVTEIAVPHYASVLAYRGGVRIPISPGFSSEAALHRALARLCHSSGKPLGDDETIVRRTLPDGASLSAVVGDAALTGAMLSVRKVDRVSSTFEELVRNGAVSRAMARFIQQCLSARANLLVVGPKDSSTSSTLSALIAACDGPLIVFEGTDDVVGDRPLATRLSVGARPGDAEKMFQVASEMPGARIAVDGLVGPMAAATLDAIGAGADGVIAVARLPSLARGVGRIVADIAATTGGAPAAIREGVVASFDLALEVARLRDGRYRVTRVSELAGDGSLKDIFVFRVERTAAGGSVEGVFQPTGVVPKIIDEMASRGINVESSMFSRPPSR